jgi:Arc/MetJ family transcription regulator
LRVELFANHEYSTGISLHLRPQDILVLLKRVTVGDRPWTYSGLAGDLGMSASAVHAAITRAQSARLYAEVLRTVMHPKLDETVLEPACGTGGRPPLANCHREQYTIRMKTTIDIPEELLSAVQSASNTRTKKEAVTVALEEYIRLRRSEELTALLGTFDAFMDRQELATLRGDS